MKILLCHNYYQQRGGEDQSFEDEARLLETHGHTIVRYTRHNDEIGSMRPSALALGTIWNRRSYRELRSIIEHERPDVVHCTNTFPLISPAACFAAHKSRVPFVQALRNYRLLCPKATFVRDGRVCEDCLGKAVAWPGVLHGCYRDSVKASAVVAGMLAVHRWRKTWNRRVTLFYTLTEFARQKFIAGGFPADRIVVKPNFIQTDAPAGDGSGGYAVFVGRLSPEKGIETLLAAWKRLSGTTRLKIIGDGPLADRVSRAAAEDERIKWLGRRPLDEVLEILGDASCLIMPSIWYETFGRTVAEAFARGTPAVVSNLGAMAELVEHGRTGLLFEPGNSDDLVCKLQEMLADPERLSRMRKAARQEFEDKFTADRNYRQLMQIYERALQAVKQQTRASNGLATTATNGWRGVSDSVAPPDVSQGHEDLDPASLTYELITNESAAGR